MILQFAMNNTLLDLIKKQSLEEIDAYFKKYPYNDKNNYHLLYYCIRNEYLDIVKLFIKNGANLNYRLQWNSPILDGAISKIEIFKLLIDNGANVYANEDSVLRVILIKDNHDITDYILSIYSFENLKRILKDEEIKIKILKFITKRDLSKYENVINVFRELGIDVFDMVEKEI